MRLNNTTQRSPRSAWKPSNCMPLTCPSWSQQAKALSRNPIADVLQCCASARRKLGTAAGKPRRCGLSTLPTGSGKVSASAARPGLANSHPRRLAQAGRAMATLAPVRAWRWHQCGNAVDQLQQCEVQFVYLRTWLVTGGRAALLGTAVHQSSPLLCEGDPWQRVGGRSSAVAQQRSSRFSAARSCASMHTPASTENPLCW